MFWKHVNQYLNHDVQFLGDNMKPDDSTIQLSPSTHPRASGQGYLFVDLRLGHLVEVLQV